jgi:hypothetical protein
VALNLMKGCKNKHYAGENASMAWESLKNNLELLFAEKQSRQFSLKKDKTQISGLLSLKITVACNDEESSHGKV